MHPPHVLQKFTSHFATTIHRALRHAERAGSDEILPSHLFVGLLEERGSIGRALVLQHTKLSFTKIRATLLPKQRENTKLAHHDRALSSESARLLCRALTTASRYHHLYVGTEHLLESFLAQKFPWFASIGLTAKSIQHLTKELRTLMKSTERFSDLTHPMYAPKTTTFQRQPRRTRVLDLYSRDLTALARTNAIDPVVGRDREIDRVTTILCRRTKNNPVLLGEAGVGKTAIVEGLAHRIVGNACPAALRGRRVVALDLGALVAGTMWRGEFEARMKQLLLDLENDAQQTILFIDELHTLVGAGASSGALDAANFLKPALARGEIHCIGATTLAEYKHSIEHDAALERRFQPIIVEESTIEETIEILRGLKDTYERHHGVSIPEEIIQAAPVLAKRYFPLAALPDKAIDLLDEAAAAVQLATPKHALEMRQQLKETLGSLARKKEQTLHQEQYAEALALQQEEEQAIRELDRLEQSERSSDRPTLQKDDLARVIATILHLPEHATTVQDRSLERLEERLRDHIVGQDHVLQRIAAILLRRAAGIGVADRPRASFLFVGPSGIGKTMVATHLADALTAEKTGLIRIDMNEFGERFNLSKLIGSPPGYVGYREQTTLTDAIKHRPHAVVLFDEIEKAHPEVLHLLLSILDTGVLTDATGRRISFREATIVFTSNLGAHELAADRLGFSSDAQQLSEKGMRAKLSRAFLPEFMNRLDAVCLFSPLQKEHIRTIIERQCATIQKTLAARGIQLTIHPDVHDDLTTRSWIPDEGARAVRRCIEERIEGQIAEHLLEDPTCQSVAITKDGIQCTENLK